MLKPSVTSGSIVRLLQKGLTKLRYSTSRSGLYDDATARSVMAWRKVTGMARTFTASEARRARRARRAAAASRSSTRGTGTTSRPTCRARCWR